MIVGTLSYTTLSGLGILAKSFFDHSIVNKVLIVPHPNYNEQDWYPSECTYHLDDYKKFVDGIDVLLLFESAFRWHVAKYAKGKGVPIVMMPMYEYTPFPLPVPADFYLCPSLLDLQYYKESPSTFLPVPVDRVWKLREKARQFVHNAGHGGHGYRNGTPELLQSLPYVKSPIRLVVRGQPNGLLERLFESFKGDSRVTLILADIPDEQLWNSGDVFIFPERFNGLSLPLQEAYASGLLVIAANRYPVNTWLPTEPLIPVDSYKKFKIAREFDQAVVSPRSIAKVIDEWYDKDITEYSLKGKDWASRNSWEELGPKYLSVLESVLKKR